MYKSKLNLNDKKFQKIINFYLFNTPTSSSVRGKKFDDYLFKNTFDFSELKRSLLAKSTLGLKDKYRACYKNELEEYYSKFNLKYKTNFEYAVFLKHSDKRVLQSLFVAIRNSLAHGSFYSYIRDKKRYYTFINYHEYNKAKINLREDTLISWIKVIEAGPKKSS